MKVLASSILILFASAAPAFAAVSVASPQNGEAVTSPFVLSANASACSSQPVSTIGYSLDNSPNTTLIRQTAVNVQVSATSGTHTLHVKTWGNQGSVCVTDVPITVVNSVGTPVPPTSSSSDLTIATPSSGQTVSSPFALSANASTCSSQPVSSIGYSLDNGSETTVVGTSISAQVSASAGAHTLNVYAWGNNGSSCSTSVALTVATATNDPAANIVPSSALSNSGVHALSNWQAQHDSGTPGSSSGKMAMVSSPAHNGPAREFITSFSSSGGERYSVSFGDDRSSTNFLYDAWIYLNSSASHIANIELDLYQTMPNGQTVLFGIQCAGYSGTWEYSHNIGTAARPRGEWTTTTAACNPRNWTTGTWHHVQLLYSHTSTGSVNYQAVWFDGVESTLNITTFGAHALGWGSSLLTQFQIDGLGSGSATAYLGDLTIYRW